MEGCCYTVTCLWMVADTFWMFVTTAGGGTTAFVVVLWCHPCCFCLPPSTTKQHTTQLVNVSIEHNTPSSLLKCDDIIQTKTGLHNIQSYQVPVLISLHHVRLVSLSRRRWWLGSCCLLLGTFIAHEVLLFLAFFTFHKTINGKYVAKYYRFFMYQKNPLDIF